MHLDYKEDNQSFLFLSASFLFETLQEACNLMISKSMIKELPMCDSVKHFVTMLSSAAVRFIHLQAVIKQTSCIKITQLDVIIIVLYTARIVSEYLHLLRQ